MISYVFLKVKRRCGKFCDTNNHADCLFHGRNGDIFIIAVEIMTAGEKIRTRQTHEGKTRTVCAAADRLNDGSDAAVEHCLLGKAYNFHVWFNLREHIIIFITQIQFDTVIILCIFSFHNQRQKLLAVREGVCVKITNDIIQGCGGDITFKGAEMGKSLRSLRFSRVFRVPAGEKQFPYR